MMFKRVDYRMVPNERMMCDYINNSLYEDFIKYMEDTYNAKAVFEFSKCSFEYGWNVKIKKGSKNLCTLYPRENYFTVLLVISEKFKPAIEKELSLFSFNVQQIYKETEGGNGQRWLMIDLEDDDKTYASVKRIIEIRQNTK